jgi:hypothetical protein
MLPQACGAFLQQFFKSLKQSLMQIICSLKSVFYAGLKKSPNHYNTTLQKRTKGHTTNGSRVEFKFPELLGSTSY